LREQSIKGFEVFIFQTFGFHIRFPMADDQGPLRRHPNFPSEGSSSHHQKNNIFRLIEFSQLASSRKTLQHLPVITSVTPPYHADTFPLAANAGRTHHSLLKEIR